jgi:D-arabinose 1-dehydrogenase-like Zn-dependent alcohol dehydrogenase
MNKVLEALLTLVVLAGLYCAIPTSVSPARNSAVRAGQAVIIADGSDPMPLCRHAVCPP